MDSIFKEIYFRYHPRVFRVAYYITKDANAAEDLVQEVFLKLWNKREKLDHIEAIEGYLVQMVKNEAIAYLEDARKESNNKLELQIGSVALNTEGDFDAEAFRLKLEEAVSKLSPKCRLIFSLSRFEGLSNDEIAEYLEISKRTVETQISLAFKRFRTDLKSLLVSLFWIMIALFGVV